VNDTRVIPNSAILLISGEEIKNIHHVALTSWSFM